MCLIDDLFDKPLGEDEYSFIPWDQELDFSPELSAVDLISTEEFHSITGAEYKEEPDRIFFIAAFTGDDAIHFTNSHEFVRTMISVEKQMSIVVSTSDTGISHKLGNFAEEWILTPLTAEMSWEDTIAFHKNEGMPWSFDCVKLRDASSIRKSGGKEADADPYDKVSNLCQRASWAIENWLTYDDHQLLSVMGKCTLDITDGPFSPLLYSTEGGSGAVCEWGNAINNVLLLGRYGQAKTLPGTYLIMKESTLINAGILNPGKAFSTKLLHLSQSDFELWKKFASLLNNPQNHGFNSELEVWDQLNSFSGERIPPDLEEKSLVISSTSFVEGTIVSRLRNLGLIMTELDVRLELITYDRQRAVAAYEKAGTYLQKLEDKKEKVKARPLKLYRSLVDQYVPSLQIKLSEEEMWTDIIDVCAKYMGNRIQSVIPHTAFSYRGQTRIFKAEDVRSYAPTRELGHLKKQLKGEAAQWIPMGNYDPHDEQKFRAIENWVNSGNLSDILKTTWPYGISTDDARIYADIQYLQREWKGYKLFHIVVTNDVRLVRACYSLQDENNEIRRLDLYSYVGLCRDIDQYKGVLNARAPFYNILTKEINKAPKKPPWGSEYDLTIFHFDVPNIEKGMRSMRFLSRSVTRDSSGFITMKTAMSSMYNGMSIYLYPWKRLYSAISRPAEYVQIPHLVDIVLRR